MSARRSLVPLLSLFASSSTLVCCALPALFVALGFGAAFAGLVARVPQLIWVSEHKALVFGTGATLLAAAALLQWRARDLACPIDPRQAEACRSARGWSSRILLLSVAIYAVGAGFAFLPELLAGG